MKFSAMGLFVFLSAFSITVVAESWTPRPAFTIEGSSYMETLIFVSGISYGLNYSNHELRSKGLKNFYCYPGEGGVDSKVLLDLLNEQLSGDHTSEEVVGVAISQLKHKYPCAS